MVRITYSHVINLEKLSWHIILFTVPIFLCVHQCYECIGNHFCLRKQQYSTDYFFCQSRKMAYCVICYLIY